MLLVGIALILTILFDDIHNDVDDDDCSATSCLSSPQTSVASS